jgi:hypothetical protein
LDSWSAVARGAAAKGLETQNDKKVVANRKCRRHYGASKQPAFVKYQYKESDATISLYDGRKRAKHQMDWLLKKGQDLSTSKPAHAKITLQTNFWPGEKREWTLRLLASDEEHAPTRSIDQVFVTSHKLDDMLLTF